MCRVVAPPQSSHSSKLPSAAEALPGELHLHLWELHWEKHKNGSLHHDYYLHNDAAIMCVPFPLCFDVVGIQIML